MVSVVIPTYNRADYVGAAVDSVLAQTYGDREIIVVDDGSTDETEAALKPHAGRIRYLQQENAGVSAARNAGIAAAEAPWIAFLDSDDFWLPDKLDIQMTCVTRTGADLCFTDFWVHDDRGTHEQDAWSRRNPDAPEYITISDPCELFAYAAPPMHIGTMLVRKDLLARIGGFDIRRRIGEDTDLIFRALRGGRGVWISSSLAVRNRTVRRGGLYGGLDTAAHRRQAEAQITALAEAYFSGYGLCSKAAADMRHRLAHALSRRAVCACVEGDYRQGRQFAREALRYTNDLRIRSRALAAWLSPRLVQKLSSSNKHKMQNWKSEYRNPEQIQSTKFE